MGVLFGYWPVFWRVFWLWPALLVDGHEDVFQEDNDLPEASGSQDDILDINQALIPLEAPESSFLIEGDIIKATPFRLFSSANPRWPKKGGIVQIPYVISHKYDKPSIKIIQEAFEDFAKFTCVKFIPYSYQRDFISIVPLSGCFSSVGRVGGMQVVSLAPACLKRGKGVALHEFMHVLGFWHEHCRADRDKYIHVSWNEILTGFEINFMKSWNTNMLVDYDYSSVMHYGRNAFSMTGLPTITPLSNSHVFLGQRWNLSSSDIARVNKLYKCSQMALQPEASTERTLQEKIKDFIPLEAEPCSAASQIKVSAHPSPVSIVEAKEMAQPARETLQKPEKQTKVSIKRLLNKPTGKGSDTTGTSPTKIPWAATLTQGRHNQTLPPPGAASKMEFLTVAQEVPSETQPTGTEVQVAQKSTLWQALEKPTSSAKELKTEPSDFEGAYSPSQQKAADIMTRTAPQVKQATSFGPRSAASLLNDTVWRTSTRLSEKAPFWPLSSTRATHTEIVTGASTPTETRNLLVMGSSESKDVSGPLHSTEGYLFTLMMEKQTEGFTQQSVGSSGHDHGHFMYVPLREGVQTKETSSLQATTSPAASHTTRVEATISSEAGSQASLAISILNGTAEEDVGSSYRTKGSRPVYILHSSTRRSSPASDLEQMPSTAEAVALGSSEVQDHHLGQVAATAAATPSWTAITSHLAASRKEEAILSQNGPMVSSVQVEWSSLPPDSLIRKGSWEENVTPSGSFLEPEWVQASVMPMKSGQAPTRINSTSFTEPASPAKETNQTMLPTERTPLGASWSQNPGLREQRENSILLPTITAEYSLKALAERLATSTGVQAEGPQTKRTALAAFMSSMSIEPNVTVSQEEETESKIPVATEETKETQAHGKESMQGALTSKSVESQMLSYTEVGWTETPQPHNVFSLVTGAQNGDTQARLRRATSLMQEMVASTSGAKSSDLKLQTKGLSFLERAFKLGSSSQPSPGTEVKEHISTLEGMLLPMHESRTAFPWMSGSRNQTESTGFGNSVEVPKDTTSSAVSKQEYTMPYERNISGITLMREGVSRIGVSNISSSSFSASLVLGNQTLKYTEEQTKSPVLRNTQSTGSSESLSPQYPSKFSSKPRETSPFTEEEPINLANATKEMLLGMKWATADSEKDLSQRATIPPFLDTQSTSMSHATIRGTTLPLTTGLLKSPKFVSYRGGPAAIGPIKETFPSMVGLTSASVVYSAGAVPIPSLEIQASIPIEAGDLPSRATKKNGEAGLGTYAGTEIYRMTSARASTLGLHGRHTISTAESKEIGIPQHTLEHETIWPTFKTMEGTQTKLFLEKGKGGVSKLGKMATAMNLALESETTAQNGGGIIATTTKAAKLVSQSGYAPSIPSFMEEPIIIHGKKEAMNISVGPTRKLVLEMMGSPIPGDGRATEMALSLPGNQNNLDSKKTKTTLHLEISSEGMYLTDMESTEGVTATTGVSLVDPQTLSPNEVRIQLKYHKSHVSQGLKSENGNNGLLPVKGSPSVVGNRELLGPSAETHTALRQEEIIQKKKIALEHKKHSSVDHSTSVHQHG
ncbi:astacin-like metalloendopeptidase [Paroedura picta]|uniref:astacin-like metalloendopeptidase n=1 Tax=Paroedura picta TaxID=143630 RepID=UPI00405687C3